MSADRITRLNAALEGRYRIESELGEGGMATVFLATDLKHERRVAIKVLKEELATVVGPERFLAEIKTTANLQHPAILPLHDSGVADGHVFYAMPHVLGATLRDRIAQEGPLPLDEVARITGEIAGGLAYAHAQGVIHRDVKPGNILLSDGHAVLADFGLAKAVLPEGAEALTEAGGVGGTIRYMSPEQVRGDAALDARADQYSLACVVYEMLTGEPLFTGRTSWAVIARQMSRELESPSIVRPEVSVATDEVIQKALELSPSDRFTDTVEFARAIADSLSTRPADRGGVRSTGSWRIPLAIGSAIVLAAAAAVNWLMPGPELDAQRVIVFPLMDQRADRTDQAIGEQVAIMVGTALEHAEPLRWVDGWDWLAVSERTDMGSWSIQRGTTIAHEQGAKFVIDGRIMDEGDSASVLLRLHDARSGALVQTSLLAGPTGELPSLGRRALVALLPNLIDPGRVVEADAFDEFAPEVVAAWLNGEREYRESRFESAFESFTRAVEGDSAMALAAIRGAQAARWLFENGTASTLIDVALANEASLSSRNRDLARGIRSYFDGDAAESERLLRGITTEYPDWSDAWMALGEVYYHLMPAIGSGGDRAEDAFRRALLNDPGFTPPLVHLAEISFRKGDAALGDSLNSVFQESNAGSVFATELDLMSMCVKSGPAAPQWAQVAGTQVGGEAVTYAAVNLGVGGAYPECATEGFQALATWGPELEGGGLRGGAVAAAWSTLVGLQSMQGARGLPEQVRDLISGADQFVGPRDYLWAMAALSGLPFGPEARDAIERLQSRAEWSTTALLSIGAWHALNGDPEVVAEAVGIARARSASAMPDSVPVFELLGDALDAWTSLARADTSDAIERFAALTPVSPPSGLQWSLWEPLAAERFTLARLRMTTGDFEGAIEAASVFDHPQPVIYVAFLGESLRLRIQAAEALGEQEVVEAYQARLDRLR